jgi:hypothetical protein
MVCWFLVSVTALISVTSECLGNLGWHNSNVKRLSGPEVYSKQTLSSKLLKVYTNLLSQSKSDGYGSLVISTTPLTIKKRKRLLIGQLLSMKPSMALCYSPKGVWTIHPECITLALPAASILGQVTSPSLPIFSADINSPYPAQPLFGYNGDASRGSCTTFSRA